MTFHIVVPHQRALSYSPDLPRSLDDGPRHAMAVLAHQLSARVQQPPANTSLSFTDQWRSRLLPNDAYWALARQIQAQTGPGDTVFCGSEAGGLQLAAVLDGNPRKRPRLAVFVHNVNRPRARAALKLWQMKDRVDVFMACSSQQVDFLRDFLNLPADRVRFVWDHSDNLFFTPGPMSPEKRRPLVVSVGLEQRDYKTLAAATGDLDLDVRISGFSEDAAVLAQTFPATLPANMERRFYSWPDLLQLYRDADAVVVSCRENTYAAGVQSLMEGMCCSRPVIATATAGLRSYLDENVVKTVKPGDAQGMRQAIQETLAQPAKSRERAKRGYALAQQRHQLDRYVREIADILQEISN